MKVLKHRNRRFYKSFKFNRKNVKKQKIGVFPFCIKSKNLCVDVGRFSRFITKNRELREEGNLKNADFSEKNNAQKF
jgi:hypothetical protein